MAQSKEINKNFELFKNNDTVYIYLSEKENSAIHIAAENLLRDIEAVCSCKAVLSKEINKCRIIIGTIENKEVITEIIKDKKLSVDKLKQGDDSLHWEAFLQEVVDDVLYIIGADRRGTIFGIYDFCEAMGVSPWYYWADVPVKKKNAFSLPQDFIKVDWPSVQYRGIFINDEEELDDWAKLHTPDGTIGPTAYSKIFELLLRLKANYIWPAMHVNYFNENPKNNALAERMGIVVGTTHCDMLLRSNQNEWTPWKESKGYTDVVYDYSIEGENRERLKEYWRESVENNNAYEVCYTMGMRGIHDSGFHTKAIDEDASLSKEEKMKARVSLLGQVIKDQRQILKEVLGDKKTEEAFKTFVPYKEVLELYDGGLELPEDITLIWANDNFGHVRRYPNETERKRSGGNGLYYHSSYWAAPGTAMSYLFINSIPLAQTGNVLKKSYESGIRKMWILNIGGLKPVEQDMEFFLRYGWEAGKERGITKNTLEFTEHWINTNFSGNHGAEAAELYETFAQVTNVRKIEHMKNHVFSQTAYGDEAGRRLVRLEDIFRRGNAILKCLPTEERAAFFQLFLLKIHASYYTNHEFYYADRSILSYEDGNMKAADKYVEFSVRMTDFKRRMLYFYNKKMSDGKWEGILTPESFPPPPTAMYPARKPALRIEGSSMKVKLWNQEETLKFYLYGQSQKWIELGNQGEGSIPFTLEIEEGADWIELSEREGTVETEKRIFVKVTEPKEHAGRKGLITVHDQRNSATFPIEVQVEDAMEIPEGFSGYIEADGYVSMLAEGYDRYVPASSTKTKEEKCGWIRVPGLGRYEGAAMMAWNEKLQPLEVEIKNNPHLEYNIFLKQGGKHMLEVYRFLTLDSTGRIRFAASVDDKELVIVETDTRDEWKGKWQDSVFDNGEKIMVELPYMAEGAHCLKLYMVDNYVTITKLVIYTASKKESNLGPAISNHIYGLDSSKALELNESTKMVAEYKMQSPVANWMEIEQLSNEFYNTKEEEVPPLKVIYATRDYNKNKDQTLLKSLEQPQTVLGEKRYEAAWKCSSKKDIIKEFGAGIFVETDGIVAIEAEYALEDSSNAYLTASKDGSNLSWSHLQAETNGRTGFAMHVEEEGVMWEEPEKAPGMHYKININNSGVYKVWMLIRHYNKKSDSCYLALDGEVRTLEEQYKKGNLYSYNTSYVYYWCLLSDLEFSAGEHVFSILARKSQFRVDRIYLTKGDELPPADAEWKDSIRK